MGAAAGGVVGAGLGAIVGNQVGNTGEGLALGAVAGAGTGALIGSALDRQETAIRTQDEAMERQERIIMAQQNELNELRQMGQDSVSFKGAAEPLNSGRDVQAASAASFSFPAQPPAHQFSQTAPSNAYVPSAAVAPQPVEPRMPTAINRVRHSNVQERDLGVEKPVAETQARGSYSWQQEQQALPEVQVAPAIAPQPVREPLSMVRAPAPVEARDIVAPEPAIEAAAMPVAVSGGAVEATSVVASAGSPECVKASNEARSAGTAREAADKLFHYRRALRLCPDNADFHNGLGEVYVSLNRNEDARYEFQEALKLQPGHSGARSNLSSIQ
jgi:tetratricopeptide (TPR) repeat protein